MTVHVIDLGAALRQSERAVDVTEAPSAAAENAPTTATGLGSTAPSGPVNGYARLISGPAPDPVLADYEKAHATAVAEDHLCKMHHETARAWVRYALTEATRVRQERSTMTLPTLDDLRALYAAAPKASPLESRITQAWDDLAEIARDARCSYDSEGLTLAAACLARAAKELFEITDLIGQAERNAEPRE